MRVTNSLIRFCYFRCQHTSLKFSNNSERKERKSEAHAEGRKGKEKEEKKGKKEGER